MFHLSRIAVRFPVLITVSSVAFAVALGYVSAEKITGAYNDAEIEGCKAAAHSIQPLVMAKAIAGDCEGIQQSVNELVTNSLVSGATINITDLRMRCQHTVGVSVFDAKTHHTLPIHDSDGVKIGDISIAYSLQQTLTAQRDAYFQIFAIIAGLFFIILMVIFNSLGRMLKPLQTVSHEMEAFDPTNPSEEALFKTGNDEVAVLVRAAGTMFDKLVAYAQRINAANHNAVHTESHLKEAQRMAKIGSWEYRADTKHFDMSEEMYRMLGIRLHGTKISWDLFWSYVAPEDREYVLQVVSDAFERVATFHMGYTIHLASGTTVEVHSYGIVRKGSDGVVHISGVTRDVTEENRARRLMEHQTYYDSLTHLPNRALLKDRLHKAIETARRTKSKVGVLFIDLDHFSLINETLGYHIGDKLLEYVAEILGRQLRGSDTIARFVGDKFIALLPQLNSPKDAENVARKLMTSLEGQHVIDKHTLFMSASLGISIYPDHAETVGELIKCSDTAMYEAKQQGRKNWQIYNAQMSKPPSHELAGIEEALNEAVQQQSAFEVFYQPQVTKRDHVIRGAEALLRWRHGDKEMHPSQFLPLLESSGDIIAMGYWIIDTVAQQLAIWASEGREDLVIWINLSARQIQDCELATHIASVIEQYAISPANLGFEVAESVLISNVESYTSQLQRLKQLGVRLAVDGFGRTPSSVEILSHFPVDLLKIDPFYIDGLEEASDGPLKKVQALIAMGEAMGFKTAFKCIENDSQEKILDAVTYGMVQGYLYSHPLSALEFAEFLASQEV